jgi:ABC-type glycerol-3-phosphate transport system substrate-binding protein
MNVSRRVFVSTAAAVASAGTAWFAAACASGGSAPATTKKLSGTVQFWTNANYPFHEDVGGEISKDFMARNPDLKVDASSMTESGVTKLTAAAAAGTPPELTTVDIYTPQSIAAAGIGQSLEPYLKMSTSIKKADLWPTHVYDLTYKGNMIAMPMGPDLRILYVSNEAYRAQGLDPKNPPKTWSDLESAVQRAYKAAGDEIDHLGFDPLLGSGGVHRWLVPFWQMGGESLNADQTKVTIFNDKGVQAMQWIVKLYNMQGGYPRIQRFNAAFTGAQQPATFTNGRVTFYYDAYTTRTLFFQKNAPNLDFSFITYPVPPNGKRANYGGGWANVLASGAKNPDAAWAFLEFISQDENNLKLVDRYDQLPIRVKTAQSEKWHKNDPFRKLAADEIPYRKFVIAAPGGADCLPIQATMVNNIIQGKVSVTDGLKDGQDQMQQIIDKFAR